MAKKRKSNSSKLNQRKSMAVRDNYSYITKLRLHRLPLLSTRLRVIQDLRTSHPLSVSRPLLSTRGDIVRPRPRVLKNFNVINNLPKEALVCARRKIRKEVIFASGRGGSKVRPPRHNFNSKLWCK